MFRVSVMLQVSSNPKNNQIMDNPVMTYKDSQKRFITIGFDEINIVAEHNEMQIGLFDFDELDNCTLLTNCSIAIDYQRAGIGIEMIKLAEQWYSEFCIVNHLSTEGAAFMTYCMNNIFNLNHQFIDDNRF